MKRLVAFFRSDEFTRSYPILPDLSVRRERALLALVAVIYIAIRMFVFAASDNGIDFHHNAYDRGLFVQKWLQDFRIVPDVAYGPVDFYLVAAVMKIVPDPILAPRLLSLFSSIALLFVLYFMVRRIFGPWEALAAGFMAALHPHGIRMSVVGLEMMPYALILISAFSALQKAHSSRRPCAWTIMAGLLFTTAAATRFEAWIILPVVCVAALWHHRLRGLIFSLCAAIFPVAWMLYNQSLYSEPFHFLGIAGNIAGVHMAAMPMWRRIVEWPWILMQYGPLPTLLLGLVGFITARRVCELRPMMISLLLTFAVFETQTVRGLMGTNETKYAMPLILLIIPYAAQELIRRINGHILLRMVVCVMSFMLLAQPLAVTIRDNRRFLAPEGAREQAAFLAALPRDGKVVIGTSLQGYLLVHGKLLPDRAVLAYPEDTTGRMSAERIAGYFREPDTRYLAYQYEDPVDFAPLMKLPKELDQPTWAGFLLRRVFDSSEGQFAVYRIEKGPPG